VCTTALAEARWELYVVGLSMSPVAQVTDLDHGGGSGEEETEDQLGSPERLRIISDVDHVVESRLPY